VSALLTRRSNLSPALQPRQAIVSQLMIDLYNQETTIGLFVYLGS